MNIERRHEAQINAYVSSNLNDTFKPYIEFFRNVPEKLRNGTKYECI